jgi:hypothetical protein
MWPAAVGSGPRSREAALQVAHLAGAAHQPFQRLLGVDAACQVHRRGAVVLGQVAGGDHAHHLAVVHHRHVVDVVAGHQQHGVEGRCGRCDAHRRQGGDVHHRAFDVQALRHHPAAQITVGDQAEQVILLPDQHRRNALFAHFACRLPDGGLRRQQHRSTPHQRTHRPRDQAQMQITARHVPQRGVAACGLIVRRGCQTRKVKLQTGQFAQPGRQPGHRQQRQHTGSCRGGRPASLQAPGHGSRADELVCRQRHGGRSVVQCQRELALQQPAQLPVPGVGIQNQVVDRSRSDLPVFRQGSATLRSELGQHPMTPHALGQSHRIPSLDIHHENVRARRVPRLVPGQPFPSSLAFVRKANPIAPRS